MHVSRAMVKNSNSISADFTEHTGACISSCFKSLYKEILHLTTMDLLDYIDTNLFCHAADEILLFLHYTFFFLHLMAAVNWLTILPLFGCVHQGGSQRKH
jgi:hypothetical protein